GRNIKGTAQREMYVVGQDSSPRQQISLGTTRGENAVADGEQHLFANLHPAVAMDQHQMQVVPEQSLRRTLRLGEIDFVLHNLAAFEPFNNERIGHGVMVDL